MAYKLLSKSQQKKWYVIWTLVLWALWAYTAPELAIQQRSAVQDWGGNLVGYTVGCVLGGLVLIPLTVYLCLKFHFWLSHHVAVGTGLESAEHLRAHINDVQQEAMARFGRYLTPEEMAEYLQMRKQKSQVYAGSFAAFVALHSLEQHFDNTGHFL